MDEKLRALLDQVPEKAPRSKLEQHLEVIRELRRKGRTYQEIAQFFTAHLNLTVAASTIHAFIQVRARRRHPRPQVELPPAAAPALGTQTPASSVSVPTTTAPPTTGDEEVWQRIQALKQRTPRRADGEKKEFVFDASEPLRLISNTQPKK
jgi:hypothetical protein